MEIIKRIKMFYNRDVPVTHTSSQVSTRKTITLYLKKSKRSYCYINIQIKKKIEQLEVFLNNLSAF